MLPFPLVLFCYGAWSSSDQRSGNREEGGRREVADMVPLYLGLLDQSGPDLGREDLIMGSEHARNLEAALIKL